MPRNVPAPQGLYDPRTEKDSCGVGFVCAIDGTRSHRLVRQGLEVLNRLSHRGAVGSDPKTGDGAGILIQMPHAFFKKVCKECRITLPEAGAYGTGIIFLPQENADRIWCKETVERIVREEGQTLLGWRSVPVAGREIGQTAQATQPVLEQVFIGRASSCSDQLSFERKLYVIRRRIENMVRASEREQKSFFYITNLSSRTFAYKGLLMTDQVERFYRDLGDELIESAICLVHSRYSTNTFPTWDLAQPFRFLAHNGEINTLRGNINWMRAKEGLLQSELFGPDIDKIKPVILPDQSDSASLDNMLELLILSGRSLPHAMLMLIPAAWEENSLMDETVRAFYRYHACLMEPWDGPAAIALTDGVRIGAVLDRNGLRPARYLVTTDGMVVMASEVGVLDIEPHKIAASGRLEPGKIFFIDTEEGRIIDDAEVKKSVATRAPYAAWLAQNMVELNVRSGKVATGSDDEQRVTLMNAFGYTREDLKMTIRPMAEEGKEPIGSMGADTPHAVLSKRPQLIYAYFKQLFAQVTNPAIDPIREKLVMSLECFMGPRKNLLAETPGHCRKVHLRYPVLTNGELESLRTITEEGFRTKTVSTLFPAAASDGFMRALDRICAEADAAISQGYTFIVLSDRGVCAEQAALPALIATGAVHQALVAKGSRSQVALIVESGEPREVQHFALLFAYGAGAVNPYLAYGAIEYLRQEKELALEGEKAQKNYIKAVTEGLLKVLSKMGISTLQSYRGAQIFEALGLHQEVIERCFAGTVSRIGGADFAAIAGETLSRHVNAYPARCTALPVLLGSGGVVQWKRDGEYHLWNPDTIAALQDSVRKEDYGRYREFAALINDQSVQPVTLRSLLSFAPVKPVPVERVEPFESIVRRFATGAMSFGSISRGAHETLALAMNRLGGRSNTGEGGEDPARFIPLQNGDSKRSSIKQVASGRFGVTTNYLVNADELQIKIAQGAKPGEGGQLPGHKVSAIIARTRYTTPGVTLISPPPHHDIYSIEDLAQLIFDLKNVNPRARISVKLVSEVGVGTIAAGVAKGHADMILISGFDGGTGASPRSSIRYAGLPWELGLSETHQTLVLNDLRSRVRLQTDGQMRTGRDVAIAALLGAEEFGFCTVALVVMGCVMLRHCHLNNCSVGVATQDAILERRFAGRPEYVQTYFRFVVQELREIMAELGVRTIDEMIGRTDLLRMNEAIIPAKAKKIDYRKILYRPSVPAHVGTYCQKTQDHGIDQVLDVELIRMARPALEQGKPVRAEVAIRNVNRTTGAMLSGELCRRYGENGLPADTIRFSFTGVAGQSFAAWLASGVTFELEGLANDYVGKGMSGGKVIMYPYRKSSYAAEKNILIGNTAFYGAIAGEAYIRGVAGERFCIRNSGLSVVVEGVGDHGCEYMTGGRVVVLGGTGRNFAAGMSGGIAYVLDRAGDFAHQCNTEMVTFEPLADDDVQTIHALVKNHHTYTGSSVAQKVLDDFQSTLPRFVKVMPIEYKRILDSAIAQEKKLGLFESSDG